jgi:glyoxylate reductase
MSIQMLIPFAVGAGYDDVDVTAAYKHGVSVTHTPGAVDDATATTAIFLILSAMRRFWAAEQSCRAGNWKKGLPLARDPEGKTLGIVGMGGIGKVVARRMTGWGMKIVYYNRRELDPKPDFECEYKSSLEDLLKVSDVVSLHMPVSRSSISPPSINTHAPYSSTRKPPAHSPPLNSPP